MKMAPIGIFDSGIGGLTVAKAIRERLPNRSIIYFGDTAHLPYGEKSEAAIISYSKKICDFLINQGCSTIIIACNTASSLAYSALLNYLPSSITLINVIDPVVDYIGKKSFKNIGVLATRATIKSEVYSKKILKVNDGITVVEKATPLFASIIEEGYFNNTISQSVIQEYLSDEILQPCDSLILGCTHYPLIKDEISSYFQETKAIIDSPSIVADKVAQILEKSERNTEEEPTSTFLMSLYTKSFEETAKLFFNQTITFKEYDLWKELEK
jgi:glutamate racemase